VSVHYYGKANRHRMPVDLVVPPQPAPQVVQVRQEQGRVAPLPRLTLGHEDLTATPVERAGKIPLLVVPRNLDPGLAALEHPHRVDLGVDVDLVLEDSRLVVGQFGQQLPQRGQLGLALLVPGLEYKLHIGRKPLWLQGFTCTRHISIGALGLWPICNLYLRTGRGRR